MTTERSAAEARRMVREHRAAEARYHATLPPTQTTRRWVLVENGTGFHCHLCGTSFGGYIDPAQSTDAAQDHVTKICPKAVRNA